MAFDYLGSVVTLVSSTLAASIGAFLSARFGSRQRTEANEAKRRKNTADAIIDRLLILRSLLRDAEQEREVTAWRVGIEGVYDALDDARHLLPDGFRHLKRSIRGAIGEATGLSFTDFWPRLESEPSELAEYDYKWTTNAIDYIDAVLDALRAWRDARPRAAEKAGLGSFDDWLAATGRYSAHGVG